MTTATETLGPIVTARLDSRPHNRTYLKRNRDWHFELVALADGRFAVIHGKDEPAIGIREGATRLVCPISHSPAASCRQETVAVIFESFPSDELAAWRALAEMAATDVLEV